MCPDSHFDPAKELLDLQERRELIGIRVPDGAQRSTSGRHIYVQDPLNIRLSADLLAQPGVSALLADLRGQRRLTFAGQRAAKKRLDAGDNRALEEMVITGLPWAVGVASRYAAESIGEFSDYYQQAAMGLMTAARRWDPGMAPFQAYASPWMHQRVRRYIADCGSPVRLPAHVWEKLQKVVRFIRHTGSLPAGMGREELSVLLRPLSLNSDLSRFEQADIVEQLLDLDELPLPYDGLVYDSIVSKDVTDEVIERVDDDAIVRKIMASPLSEREKHILTLRFALEGVDGKQTLEQIAVRLGLTRERVRQIEEKSLLKLRAYLGKERAKQDRALLRRIQASKIGTLPR